MSGNIWANGMPIYIAQQFFRRSSSSYLLHINRKSFHLVSKQKWGVISGGEYSLARPNILPLSVLYPHISSLAADLSKYTACTWDANVNHLELIKYLSKKLSFASLGLIWKWLKGIGSNIRFSGKGFKINTKVRIYICVSSKHNFYWSNKT